MSWPAWKNAERAAQAADKDRRLAAAILRDRELLGAMSPREQAIVAKRYLGRQASWEEIASSLGLTKNQVTGTWRRMCARQEIRDLRR